MYIFSTFTDTYDYPLSILTPICLFLKLLTLKNDSVLRFSRFPLPPPAKEKPTIRRPQPSTTLSTAFGHGARCIVSLRAGFFGTRNMGFLHQQLVEILSYALVLTENHIFTSGATGTNAAVIRGALRAERPDLLTVVLPQSLSKQPEVGEGERT